jgi:hypothetical protein
MRGGLSAGIIAEKLMQQQAEYSRPYYSKLLSVDDSILHTSVRFAIWLVLTIHVCRDHPIL